MTNYANVQVYFEIHIYFKVNLHISVTFNNLKPFFLILIAFQNG
jgi:hypothetical protein